MKKFSFLRSLWMVLGVGLTPLALCADAPHMARAERGMVATVHPLATDAAVEAFRRGGNAIDAAVAAALTLGVVDGYNSGIGGGCFILIHLANGELVAIDGREMAPAAAHPEMFIVNGTADTSLSQAGALASAIPGALAAYAQAVEEFGRLPLADLLKEGVHWAEEGFPIRRAYAARIREVGHDLRRFEGSRELFFHDDGSPLRAGEVLRQPDLARTYRGIAEHGPDWFYRGPVARTIAEWMEQNGGILTEADFASYRTVRREPLVTSYRGHQIVGMPPPSSGGVHVAQILNILEHFDPALLQAEPAVRIHLLAEAMKLAFADRAHWLGDPDYAPVPKGLADSSYAKGLAARIDLTKAAHVPQHDFPPKWEENVFRRHTTHLSTADEEGNWVALTATVNTGFGSKVVVPGTGIILNNEMDDFSIHPGIPNAFGLIGSDANKVEAGKRPLSSMSPTLVFRDGVPVMSLGAAGGPTIISQTVLAIVGVLDLGLSGGEALAQSRFHHQWAPHTLRVEDSIPETLLGDLEKMGHTVERVRQIGVSQAVVREGRELLGVHDPRVDGKSGGW
jgi:gamma-glutamyltranspeptidase / glutathione hydrolase